MVEFELEMTRMKYNQSIFVCRSMFVPLKITGKDPLQVSSCRGGHVDVRVSTVFANFLQGMSIIASVGYQIIIEMSFELFF